MARATLCISLLIGISDIPFVSSAEASTSWSAYLRTCVPVLVNQWTADFHSLENALGTRRTTTITNAVSVFEVLDARELSSCTNSPDKTLNGDVTRLTYYQYTALEGVRGVLKGTVSANLGNSKINQMISHEKTVGSRLANDLSIYG